MTSSFFHPCHLITLLVFFSSSHHFLVVGAESAKNNVSLVSSVVSSPNILVLEASSVKKLPNSSLSSPSSSVSSGPVSIIQQINSKRFGDLRLSNLFSKKPFGLPQSEQNGSPSSVGSGLPLMMGDGWRVISSSSAPSSSSSNINPDSGGESRLKSLFSSTSSRLKGNAANPDPLMSIQQMMSGGVGASATSLHPVMIQLNPQQQHQLQISSSSQIPLLSSLGSSQSLQTSGSPTESQVGLGSSSSSSSDLGFSASHVPEGVKLSHQHHLNVQQLLNSDHREHQQSVIEPQNSYGTSSSSSSLFQKIPFIPRIPRLNLRPSNIKESLLNSHKDHISLSKMIPFLFPYKLTPPSGGGGVVPSLPQPLAKNKLIPLGLIQGLLKPKFLKSQSDQQQQQQQQQQLSPDLLASDQKPMILLLNQNGQQPFLPQTQNLQMLQSLISLQQQQQQAAHDENKSQQQQQQQLQFKPHLHL